MKSTTSSRITNPSPVQRTFGRAFLCASPNQAAAHSNDGEPELIANLKRQVSYQRFHTACRLWTGMPPTTREADHVELAFHKVPSIPEVHNENSHTPLYRRETTLCSFAHVPRRHQIASALRVCTTWPRCAELTRALNTCQRRSFRLGPLLRPRKLCVPGDSTTLSPSLQPPLFS